MHNYNYTKHVLSLLTPARTIVSHTYQDLAKIIHINFRHQHDLRV